LHKKPGTICHACSLCTTELEKQKQPGVDRINHGLAFAELLTYIEDTRMDSLVAPIFKLSDLVDLYTTRLEQLGTDVEGRVHSTDLKREYWPTFQTWKLTSKAKMWFSFHTKMLEQH